MRLPIDVNCNHAHLFWASERMIDWKTKWVHSWLRDVMESVVGRWGNWVKVWLLDLLINKVNNLKMEWHNYDRNCVTYWGQNVTVTERATEEIIADWMVMRLNGLKCAAVCCECQRVTCRRIDILCYKAVPKLRNWITAWNVEWRSNCLIERLDNTEWFKDVIIEHNFD